MSFAYPDAPRLNAHPGRLMLGAMAAFIIPAAIGALVMRGGFFPLVIFGAMSVLAVFLPLVAWQLPNARHPLLTCLVLGAIASPGPAGYALMVMSLFSGISFLIPLGLLIAAPHGIAGGFVFWLCVIWRNPDFGAANS